MMNLSGKPVIAFKDGLWQFGWYRGCSRPLVDGERFFIPERPKKRRQIGWYREKREARPMGRLLFLCFLEEL